MSTYAVRRCNRRKVCSRKSRKSAQICRPTRSQQSSMRRRQRRSSCIAKTLSYDYRSSKVYFIFFVEMFIIIFLEKNPIELPYGRCYLVAEANDRIQLITHRQQSRLHANHDHRESKVGINVEANMHDVVLIDYSISRPNRHPPIVIIISKKRKKRRNRCRQHQSHCMRMIFVGGLLILFIN